MFTDFIFFTDRLGNKPFLIWLLTTPSHLKYVAALACTLSLIACFLILMFFSQGSMATYASVLGILITTLLQIYYRIFQQKKENRLRIDRIIAMSLLPRFYGPQCTLKL